LPAAALTDEPVQRCWFLDNLAGVLAGAGHAEQALHAVAGLDDVDDRASGLHHVATTAGIGEAEQALHVAAGIDHPERRAWALADLVSDFAARSTSEQEIGRRALEMLLLTAEASDHLTALPVTPLRRLVVDGHL
jgi:hypothetical protein